MFGVCKDRTGNCNLKYRIYRERNVFEVGVVALLSVPLLLLIYFAGVLGIWFNSTKNPIYVMVTTFGLSFLMVLGLVSVVIWPYLCIKALFFHKALIFEESKLVRKGFLIQRSFEYSSIMYAKVGYKSEGKDQVPDLKMVIWLITDGSEYKITFNNRAAYNELISEMRKHFLVKEQ